MLKNWIIQRERTKCLITRMHGQNNPKISTLKSSTRLNMKGLIEEHDEVLNTTKDNGTTETI